MARTRFDGDHDVRTPVVARIIWTAIIVLVVSVPVIVFTGYDSFRVVKQSLFITGGLFIAATMIVSALVWRLPPELRRLPRRIVWLAAAILAWTAIGTLLSTNPTLSTESLLWVAANIAFALAIVAFAPKRSLGAAWWPFAGVLVNAVVLFCQVTRIWNPFVFNEWVYEYELRRIRHTALVGNPNDVGAYFVAPALAAIALGIATQGRRRYVALIVAAICVFGVIGSETLTALIAVSAGVVVLTVRTAGKRAIAALVVLAVVAAVAVPVFAPLKARAEQVVELARQGELNQLLSGRLAPFLAAFELWKSRPLLGVGPGCFGWHYFDTKLHVDRRYASWLDGDTSMYHEVHNDHLQVLSQAGIPGYLLFLGALIVAAAPTFSRNASATEDSRVRFAKLLALPLAVSFSVLALAGFPLELAAPMSVFLYFGGLCEAWTS